VDNLDADGEGIDVQLFEDTSQLKQHALTPHRQRRSAGLSDHRSATISVDQGGNLVIDAGANETGAEHLLKVGALEVQGAFSIPNHPNIADSLTMLAKNYTATADQVNVLDGLQQVMADRVSGNIMVAVSDSGGITGVIQSSAVQCHECVQNALLCARTC
jgi:hypothetical protein